jgi:hypothetical protein
VATLLNNLDYTKVGCPAAGDAGNCNLPDVNNSIVRGAVMRLNGFSENFISTNPQFGTTNWFSNMGNTNYHSLQVEATLRPTHGFSGTANYTFSKNLGLQGNTFTNPVDRHPDYSIVLSNHPHIFRTNGNIEVPIGPGKLLLGKTHGAVARAIEGWRLGSIYTISSGPYASITAQNTLYANGVPDVADPALLKELLANAGTKWGVRSPLGATIEGDFFDRSKWVMISDPQCAGVTSLQSLNATNGIATCTLLALARIVPDGTAGAIANIDGQGHSGKYVLMNPGPGVRGNLGQNVVRTIPVWRFDSNIAKSFAITETKTLQFRLDVFNILNNAQPANPNLSINTSTTPFGQITSKNAKDPRTLQAQLRFDF